MWERPSRRLANAIFVPSGDHAGSTWKNACGRRPAHVVVRLRAQPPLPAAVGTHAVDRVVAVTARDEGDLRLGARGRLAAAAGGQQRERGKEQGEENRRATHPETRQCASGSTPR